MRLDWAGVPQEERGKDGAGSEFPALPEVLRDESVHPLGILDCRVDQGCRTCPAEHKPWRNTPCRAESFHVVSAANVQKSTKCSTMERAFCQRGSRWVEALPELVPRV